MMLDLVPEPLPFKFDANLVEGMMENERLARVLELMTTHQAAVAAAPPAKVWYQDAHFSIAGPEPRVEIKDIMRCSLNQAKLIASHFPLAGVRAVVLGDPPMTCVEPRLRTLARGTKRSVTVVWPLRPRTAGLELAGTYPWKHVALKVCPAPAPC